MKIAIVARLLYVIARDMVPALKFNPFIARDMVPAFKFNTLIARDKAPAYS